MWLASLHAEADAVPVFVVFVAVGDDRAASAHED